MEATPRLDDQKRADTICGVLKHPLRVRILEILNEGPKSPSQFVEEGLVPEEHYSSYQQALSLASYHFRALEKDGCAEGRGPQFPAGARWTCLRSARPACISPTRNLRRWPRRAPAEALAHLSFRAWSPGPTVRCGLDTFDARTDRYLVWVPMQLDERGWDELSAALARCFGEVEQIRHDSKDRLAASGEESIPTTFGMLGFESPPPPPLPEAVAD